MINIYLITIILVINMGLCYSIDISSKENYSVILKLPHNENCYEINQNSNSWNFNQNVNNVLKKLYNDKLNNWIVYNDENPNDDNAGSTFAHAKGILAWNNNIITWLIHSVPKFPESFDGTNKFPDINHSELEYGQSFIFIKLDIKNLENILTQLFIMKPNIYISNFNYDNFKKLHKKNEYKILKINEKIYHVTKSHIYNKDLYEDILIPNFGGPCYTETWVRGHHCTENEQCKMINKISWNNGIEYIHTQDHSKYCYSDKNWVMVGDLNRMTSQFKRGGGGIIIKDNNITKLFKEIMKN